VVDALNLGRLASKEETSPILQEKILDFVQNYGLLGFMTALPTTADFMDYKQVYLPKNGAFIWPRSSEEAAELTEEQYRFLMAGLDPMPRRIREVQPQKLV
jgi:hypothetical protein